MVTGAIVRVISGLKATRYRVFIATALAHLLPLRAAHGGSVTKSDFLCSAHFSLDKRDDIGYSCSVGLGRGQVLPARLCQKVLFRFGPWSLPVVSASKCSRGVKESRSWEVETSRRPHLSGRSLGRRWGHSWTFRLADLPAPELGERVGGQHSEKNTKYYERSQYVIENKGRHVQTNSKRTPNEP